MNQIAIYTHYLIYLIPVMYFAIKQKTQLAINKKRNKHKKVYYEDRSDGTSIRPFSPCYILITYIIYIIIMKI